MQTEAVSEVIKERARKYAKHIARLHEIENDFVALRDDTWAKANGEPQRIRAPGYERRLARGRSKFSIETDRRADRRLRRRSRECVVPR